MLEDVLRPSNDAFKAFYELGYRTWSKLRAGAVDDCPISPACLEWESLFPEHPVLPVGLDPDESGLLTAKSTWLSSQGRCDASAVEQTFQMTTTIGKPTSVVLADDPDLSLSQWFGKDDGHVVVLMLAWAYALSARWAEIIPRASPMQYTTNQAPWMVHPDLGGVTEDGGRMVVELGEVTGEAAQWWTAILAPGEGWKVAIPHERWRLFSPWSITKEFQNMDIFLSGSPSYVNSGSPIPASFETALRYIDEYSILHNASKQSRAALAAALLPPLARLDNRKVRVHAPRGPRRQPGQIETPRPSPFENRHLRQFDRLLTLSLNARGMKAILGSIFYQSGVPANACGAWLQGTMAVLQLQGTENLHLLARMFFDRSPHISYLWLGGIITGAHKDFLRSTSSLLGLNRIDRHAAAWTGTLLPFIQEPVSPIHHDTTSISRADECRLMFLTQEPRREFPPMYPYPPLGETDIKDADLGVQLHAHCPATHGLQFLSVTWNCVGGRKDGQTAESRSVMSEDCNIAGAQTEDEACEVDYSWLDRERDLSEGVTRNLFCWMRDMDGFTIAERDIYRHEWLDAFDSDDESVYHEGDGRSTTGPIAPQMGSWMAESMTRRCSSV